MKLLNLLLFAGPLLAYALQPPAGYTVPQGKQELIFADDFREGMRNWVPSNKAYFSVTPSGGFNGSAGVVFNKTNPKSSDDLNRCFHLISGAKYRAAVRYRVENPRYTEKKSDNIRAHTMYLFSKAGKKYLSGKYPVLRFTAGKDTSWDKVTIDFAVPVTATETNIKLGFYTPGEYLDMTGRIIYDDFTLERTGEAQPELYPVHPKCLSLTPDRKMKIRVHNPARIPEGDLRLRVVFGKNDRLLPVRNGFAELTLPELPAGKHLFEYQLLDQNRKLVLLNTGYTFVRHDPKTGNFDGRTELTKDERLTVNGKPFFMLQLCIGPKKLDKEAVLRMKDAGFTAVMPYSSLTMDIEKKGGKPSLEKIRTALDFCHRNGLKVTMCLKEQIHNEVREFEGIMGAENIVAYAVEKLKTHPAILSWYIADENPLNELPRIMKLRERISHIDPWHPVSVCVCSPSYLYTFCQAGDMMVPDWYPINDKNSRSMSILRSYINPDIGIGTWFSVQAYNKGSRNPTKKDIFRFPTEEEMRSMALLCLNCGAKGLDFFSYSVIFGSQEKAYPGSGKWFWPQLAKVIGSCRSLEEFFLTGSAPETVKHTSSGKNLVEAKLYRNGKKVCVIITGDGPGKADALLTLPKNLKFRSLYGHTVQEKNGTWHFTGTDICSDVLLAQ